MIRSPYREHCSERTPSPAGELARSLALSLTRRTACLFPAAAHQSSCGRPACVRSGERELAPRPPVRFAPPRRADSPSLRTAIRASIGRPAPYRERGGRTDGRPGILTLTSCMLRASEGGGRASGRWRASPRLRIDSQPTVRRKNIPAARGSGDGDSGGGGTGECLNKF